MQIFASNEKSCERKNMEPHSVPAIISLKTFRAEGGNFQQSAQRRGKGGGASIVLIASPLQCVGGLVCYTVHLKSWTALSLCVFTNEWSKGVFLLQESSKTFIWADLSFQDFLQRLYDFSWFDYKIFEDYGFGCPMQQKSGSTVCLENTYRRHTQIRPQPN